ncbi:hypothetical protein GE118_04215 [Mycoplasma sp. NEAQ87857]|uniref:ArdC family protein n=1 Tax=Mycoplasma sp. NEAQ87857 TaxID=2683967 RepID=UPI001316255C|nr:ArdC family protein [Mycoplasma sp. NEAQ87857]QGZ97981.1 hypothetical protein GE118_04215 [Mycoplasma sp. NEAQ87857]
MYSKYNKDKTFKSNEDKTKELKELVKNEVLEFFNNPEMKSQNMSFILDPENKYSFLNKLLIVNQFPKAYKVKGFNEWSKNKINVKKGESGIKIFQPIKNFFYIDEQNKKKYVKGPEEVPEGVKLETTLNFKVGYVFDIRQTNAESKEYGAKYFDKYYDSALYEDINNKLLENLKEKIKNSGLSVEEAHLSTMKRDDSRTYGFVKKESKKIVLNEYNLPEENNNTLLHEMSHYVAEKHTGLEYLQFRSEHENEAELSAMMLMKWIGIEDEDAYQKSKEYAYQWLTAKSFTNADANLSKEERIKKAFEENHDKLLKLIENAGKIASEVIKTFSLEEVRREYSNDKWKLHQEVDDFRKINEPNLLTYKEIINNILTFAVKKFLLIYIVYK